MSQDEADMTIVLSIAFLVLLILISARTIERR